jgi:hypothetical protein
MGKPDLKALADTFVRSKELNFEQFFIDNNISEDEFAELMYHVLNNVRLEANFALLKNKNKG